MVSWNQANRVTLCVNVKYLNDNNMDSILANYTVRFSGGFINCIRRILYAGPKDHSVERR